MTAFVTGKTGKTGFSLFLACKNQNVKKSENLRKIYRGYISPGLFGFSGSGLSRTSMEKDIVAAILRHLRTRPRCFAWKTHGGMYGTAGIPDIIACIDGRFYAFEVKQPKGRLTALQEATLRKIRAAGGVAAMVTSVDEVKAALSEEGGNDE